MQTEKTKAWISGSWWTIPLGNIMTATYIHTAFTAKPESDIQISSDLFFLPMAILSAEMVLQSKVVWKCIFPKKLAFQTSLLKEVESLAFGANLQY